MSKDQVKISESDQAKQEEEPTHKGAILKKEREAQGILIETVHEATKIPLDSLRAIEENYKIRILSDFYYKSFLKMYAKYLGLDVSKVIDIENKTFVPKPPVEEEKNDFDILDKINQKFTKERKRQIFYVLAALLCVWLLIKFTGFLFSKRPKVNKTTSSQRVDPSNRGKNATVIPGSGNTSDQGSANSIQTTTASIINNVNESPTINSSKNVVLTVRAKKESWLRVKVDGNVVFQSTLNAGDVETWDANDQIEIAGRNISQLEFELNGKMIGSLGRASRRAKGLIATKDGLSVTK